MSDTMTTEAEEATAKSLTAMAAECVSLGLWALAITFILRTFVFQPFHIPSPSMEPNLVKGDYVITSKYSVGYGKFAAKPLPFPVKRGRLFERDLQRGDILVFKPIGSENTYIKRLAGLPGDQMQMQNGVLYINGTKAVQTPAKQNQNAPIIETWRETFSGGHSHEIYDTMKRSPTDNTSVYTVPSGHYFLLGDNRDNSADSRVPTFEGGAGYVPAENIIGRAEFVLLSAEEDFSLVRPWTWGHIRGDRFFKGLR